jgi:hypothetical protein
VALLLVLAFCPLSLAQDDAAGISDAQLADLGRSWVKAFNEHDESALNDVLAFEILAARSAASFTDNESERTAFVRGFMAGRGRFAQNMITQMEVAHGHALYLKVHSFNGMRGALVRYDFETQGNNYVLLIAENLQGSRPRVVDLFVATNGRRLSETLGAVSQLLVAPSESLLGKLFGATSVDKDLAATFKQIGELQLQGKTAEVYAKLTELPEPIRNHRVVLNMSVQASSLVGEDAYREELARLARYHRDDPTTTFALIDYYFYKGDFDAAMRATLSMERAFGLDAAIAMLKANVALAARDLPQARKFAEQAVELEPENEASRWTLLGVLMPAEQYADGIEVLDGLEPTSATNSTRRPSPTTRYSRAS